MSTPALFKPIARGPQLGAPPSLEFIAIDRLSVDPAYQRATDGARSRRIIVQMVREWDWRLCHPLVVSRRADGDLLILDGQHRHAGATERGDIAHLPCVVLPGLDAGQEARTFVRLNTERQNLSQTDIFNGMLAAGDDLAKQTAAIIAETGWRVVRSSATDGWKPGDLVCAPMLLGQIRIHGADTVRAALRSLRTAYPETVVTSPANMRRALIAIFAPKAIHDLDEAAVTRALATHGPDVWMARAHKARLDRPDLSVIGALTAAIARAVKTPRDAAPRPAAPAITAKTAPRPAPPIRQAPAAKAPAKLLAPVTQKFGTSGKGWCDQCETLVSRETTSACRGQFCKMKAAA